MKQIVLRSPVVLYETVEALYQHVNGLSVEGRKRDLLQKFGSKLTRTEREQIEQSCALAAKVTEAACTGLEDGPALETFFRKWETGEQVAEYLPCQADNLQLPRYPHDRSGAVAAAHPAVRRGAAERPLSPAGHQFRRHQLLCGGAGANDPAAVRAAGRPDD